MKAIIRTVAIAAAAGAACWATTGTGAAVASVSHGARTITDVCGASALDYVSSAQGLPDTAFAGKIGTPPAGGNQTLTVTPEGFGPVNAPIPAPYVTAEINSGAEDDEQTSTPLRVAADSNGRGRVTFGTPWGIAESSDVECAKGTRVNKITGVVGDSRFTISRT